MLESRDVFVLFHFQVLQVMSGKVPKQKAKPKAAPLSEPVLAGKTCWEGCLGTWETHYYVRAKCIAKTCVFALCHLQAPKPRKNWQFWELWSLTWVNTPKQRMPARLLTATLVKLTKFFQKLGAYHLFFSACSHFEKRRFCVDNACTLTDKSSWKGRHLKMKLVLLHFSLTARRLLVPKIVACIMFEKKYTKNFLDRHSDIMCIHTTGYMRWPLLALIVLNARRSQRSWRSPSCLIEIEFIIQCILCFLMLARGFLLSAIRTNLGWHWLGLVWLLR